ncbi:hypothetical protein [Paraburkholderia sp.]|uniref:hypothetical protein n=1 Tax=Paraburkholderia sp. TaxID=1926495 RepID=UPI002F41B8EB
MGPATVIGPVRRSVGDPTGGVTRFVRVLIGGFGRRFISGYVSGFMKGLVGGSSINSSIGAN